MLPEGAEETGGGEDASTGPAARVAELANADAVLVQPLRGAQVGADVQQEAAAPVVSDGEPSHPAPLSNLDVAAVWRELPKAMANNKEALLRACHARAHGSSCKCLASSSKVTKAWRNAVAPLTTGDRCRPLSAACTVQWAQKPFLFDFSTMARPTAVPAAASVATSSTHTVCPQGSAFHVNGTDEGTPVAAGRTESKERGRSKVAVSETTPPPPAPSDDDDDPLDGAVIFRGADRIRI